MLYVVFIIKRLFFYHLKVAIVGEPQTGKTCICKQVVSDGTNFLRNYLMTHALDVSVKSINIPDTNDVIEMYLLDCSGRFVSNNNIIFSNKHE